MPIYEYTCAACGKPSELFRRSIAAAEAAGATCPHCGSDAMRRRISQFAVGHGADVYGSSGQERYLDALDDLGGEGGFDGMEGMGGMGGGFPGMGGDGFDDDDF